MGCVVERKTLQDLVGYCQHQAWRLRQPLEAWQQLMATAHLVSPSLSCCPLRTCLPALPAQVGRSFLGDHLRQLQRLGAASGALPLQLMLIEGLPRQAEHCVVYEGGPPAAPAPLLGAPLPAPVFLLVSSNRTPPGRPRPALLCCWRPPQRVPGSCGLLRACIKATARKHPRRFESPTNCTAVCWPPLVTGDARHCRHATECPAQYRVKCYPSRRTIPSAPRGRSCAAPQQPSAATDSMVQCAPGLERPSQQPAAAGRATPSLAHGCPSMQRGANTCFHPAQTLASSPSCQSAAAPPCTHLPGGAEPPMQWRDIAKMS